MDFEKDAQEQNIAEDKIELIKVLAKDQLHAEKVLKDFEEKLELAKKQLNQIQLQELPQALMDAGIEELVLDDMTITVKEDLKASISKDNARYAYDWLRKHGHDNIIKNELKVNIPAGNDQIAEKIAAYILKETKLKPERKEAIHSSTLKAFCKEMLEKGENLPEDLLGIFKFRKTKIKQKEA